MTIKNIIGKSSLFDGLCPNEIDQIISLCQEEAFEKDKIIIEEDDTCTNIYIILEGRLRVELKTYSVGVNREDYRYIATLRKGEVFGEITFLGGGRRSARVSAVEDIRLVKIGGPELHNLFEKDYHLGYVMMRNIASILARRLSDINFKLRDNI